MFLVFLIWNLSSTLRLALLFCFVVLVFFSKEEEALSRKQATKSVEFCHQYCMTSIYSVKPLRTRSAVAHAEVSLSLSLACRAKGPVQQSLSICYPKTKSFSKNMENIERVFRWMVSTFLPRPWTCFFCRKKHYLKFDWLLWGSFKKNNNIKIHFLLSYLLLHERILKGTQKNFVMRSSPQN